MQAHSNTTKKYIKIGITTGALTGVAFVLLSALIAYFFVEPNVGVVTHGVIKIINFFHPLNPTIIASGAITIGLCTLIGLLIGAIVAHYNKKH